MSHSFAIADTCFLIDWARYRRRDLLFKLFKTVFVPESVLREVKSENTISWIAASLARGALALYTETPDEVEEARRLVEASRLALPIPVDLPEAICLAVGRRRGYVVLTENRGALMARDAMTEYSGVAVWRSFEILTELHKRGEIEIDCGNPLARYEEYQLDTKHLFPRKDILRATELVNEICRSRSG